MPAVPSGRGCDACRKAKKKCDSGIPVCARCIRRNTVCIESGERRFQFKGPKCYRRPVNLLPPASIQRSPNNGSQGLLLSFLKTINSDTEYRFNLLHHGPFLEHVPQRLGRSEAPDAATRALVLSHQDICLRQEPSIGALEAYGIAVRKLRIALNDTSRFSTICSLGAASILVICRNFNGISIEDWTMHTLGAAEIIRARRHIQPQDDFEHMLLLYLQSYLVGHCLYFRSMRLDADRFENLVKTLAHDLEPNHILRHLCSVPRLIQRGKSLCDGSPTTESFFQEIRSAYQTLMNIRYDLREILDTNLLEDGFPRFNSLAGYALTLSLCLVYHCILLGPKFKHYHHLDEEDMLIDAALHLMKEVEHLSPLGSAYILLTLSACWLCCKNTSKMLVVERSLHNGLQNYRQSASVDHLVQRLKELRYDLQLRTKHESPIIDF